MPDPSYAFLLQTDRAEQITAVRHALTAAGIPYETGLEPGPSPRVIFFVPGKRLQQARGLTTEQLLDEPDGAFHEEELPARPVLPARFPWGPVRSVAFVILSHLGLVFWSGGSLPSAPLLFQFGAIVPDLTLAEPWRLLTSLFLHADLRHALWNGVSMLVFAVPLIVYLGYGKTWLIYLVAGLGGGITASGFAQPESIIIGSSGAVSGLFGAWIVLTLRRARHSDFTWRARVRTLGIALLLLPSLLSPINARGQNISVSSHIGGLATGMVIGAVMSERMLGRGRDRQLLADP